LKLARDGYPLIAFTGFMLLGSLFFAPPVALFLAPLMGLVIWFFRDPERVPDGEGFLAPADGRILEIVEADIPFTGKAWKIGIYMNALDVHVNRFPCAGTVEHVEYVPGRKWLSFAPKASETNERMLLGVSTEYGPLLLVQIAGFLARRIVCRVRNGDRLERGQRYGMIKMGSKVDVYLPEKVALTISKGQRVFAGRTVIGNIPGDED
jgi:phosphatidylserine decarboxylase